MGLEIHITSKIQLFEGIETEANFKHGRKIPGHGLTSPPRSLIAFSKRLECERSQ